MALGHIDASAAPAQSPVAPPPPEAAPAAPHAACRAALAPASMAALIETQAQLASDPSVLVRYQTAHNLDQLISRLEPGPPPPPPHPTGLTAQRLETARKLIA